MEEASKKITKKTTEENYNEIYKKAKAIFEILHQHRLSAGCNSVEKRSVSCQIAVIAYKKIKQILFLYSKSRLTENDDEKKEILHTLFSIREVTDDENKLLKGDVNRKVKKQRVNSKENNVHQCGKYNNEDKSQYETNPTNNTTSKVVKPPTKRETILMTTIRSALVNDLASAVCYLHFGKIAPDVVEKVNELVISEENSADVSKCFQCKNVTPVLYSTACCRYCLKICESCLEMFSMKYIHTREAGKKLKIGNFSCYNCNTKYTYPIAGVTPDNFVDYTAGTNQFFARFWFSVLNSVKPSILSGREDLLVTISTWLLKILADDISPAFRIFLTDVNKYKTTRKDLLVKCREIENAGKNVQEYLTNENQKKVKKCRKPAINPTPTIDENHLKKDAKIIAKIDEKGESNTAVVSSRKRKSVIKDIPSRKKSCPSTYDSEDEIPVEKIDKSTKIKNIKLRTNEDITSSTLEDEREKLSPLINDTYSVPSKQSIPDDFFCNYEDVKPITPTNPDHIAMDDYNQLSFDPFYLSMYDAVDDLI